MIHAESWHKRRRNRYLHNPFHRKRLPAGPAAGWVRRLRFDPVWVSVPLSKSVIFLQHYGSAETDLTPTTQSGKTGMSTEDLPNLAGSLHASRKLTPEQTRIRNRHGFLDSNDQPYLSLDTIRGWLTDPIGPTPLTKAPRQEPIARSVAALNITGKRGIEMQRLT